MTSPQEIAMLYAIRLQEGRFLHRRQLGDGPARGLWQFAPIAAILLSSCSALTPQSGATGPSPLVVVSCPDMAELTEDSFGATRAKLI